MFITDILDPTDEHEQNCLIDNSQNGTSASKSHAASTAINLKLDDSAAAEDYDGVSHSHSERKVGQSCSVTKCRDADEETAVCSVILDSLVNVPRGDNSVQYSPPNSDTELYVPSGDSSQPCPPIQSPQFTINTTVSDNSRLKG